MGCAIRALEGCRTEIGNTSFYTQPCESWTKVIEMATGLINEHYNKEGFETKESTVRRVLTSLRKTNTDKGDSSTPNPKTSGGGAGGGEPRDPWTKSLHKFQDCCEEATCTWKKEALRRKNAKKAKDDADKVVMNHMNNRPMTSDEDEVDSVSQRSLSQHMDETSGSQEDLEGHLQNSPSAAASSGASSSKSSRRSKGKDTTKSDPFDLLASVESSRLKLEAKAAQLSETEQTKRLELKLKHEIDMMRERAKLDMEREMDMIRERAKLDMEREKYQKESMAEIMKVLQQEQQTFLLKVLHRNQDNDSN